MFACVFSACEDENDPTNMRNRLERAERLLEKDEVFIRKLLVYIDEVLKNYVVGDLELDRQARMNLRREGEDLMRELRNYKPQSGTEEQKESATPLDRPGINFDRILPQESEDLSFDRELDFIQPEGQWIPKVYFPLGSYIFDQKMYVPEIQRIADSFKQYPAAYTFVVVGYADPRDEMSVEQGEMDEWNLSVLRATQVLRALREAGIPSDQLLAVGRGILKENGANVMDSARVEIRLKER